MFLSLRSLGRLLLGVALALSIGSLPACGSDRGANTELPPEGKPGVDASILFEQEETIALAPGEIADISVRTSPPDTYAISFLLVGESLDASLDQTSVVADPDGRAAVRLRAPKGASNFVVRAKIKDGPAADLQVAVSDQGFGSLHIVPTYNGARSTREWVAQVVSGTTCEALAPDFPIDLPGALTSSAEPDEPLVIGVAPVGPNLAVFVRAGFYMWGCANEPDLRAGETVDVPVTIINKPIDATHAVLDLQLDFVPEADTWAELLASQQALMEDAFFDGLWTSDLLLATMASLYPDPSSFEAAAIANDWVTEVNIHLVQQGIDMHASIEQLLAAASAAELPTVQGRIAALSDEPGFGIFSLASLGSSTPDLLGIPDQYVVSLAVDSDDTARVGGTLYWMPSRYLAPAVEESALEAEPQHPDMRALLADRIGCADLVLTGFQDCEGACIVELCADAMLTRWQQVADASAVAYQFGEIPFQASGPASFDQHAALRGFQGSWLGKVVVGEHEAKVSGAAAAETPSDVPPAG